MNKYIFSIFLFINSIFAISAQNNADAERLINNFINSVKSEAVRSDFTLKISEKNAVHSQQFSGIVVLRANQFYLEMDELMVWFDGKTQWAYLKESNEVNITEPTEEELAEINPIAIISGLKSISAVQFGKVKNQMNHIIELTPKNKNATFTKSEVHINKSSGHLAAINIKYKNGTNHELVLKNYQKNVPIKQKTFVFDKGKFKGAAINDLR